MAHEFTTKCSETFSLTGPPAAGVFVMQKGHLRHVDAAMAEMLGYSDAGMLTGKSFRALIHPDDLNLVRMGSHRKTTLGTARSKCFRMLRKDGSAIEVDIQGELVLMEGRPALVGSIIETNCMTKVPENAPRAAICQAPREAIITVSPEMIIIDANASAKELCALPKQIAGRHFVQCLPQCSAACGSVLQKALEQKQIMQAHQMPCDLENPLRRLVNVKCVPLLDGSGESRGALLFIRDVTLLRNIERSMRLQCGYLGLIGKSKSMQNIYHTIEDLADREDTVLITGEIGTGKRIIAKTLRNSGCRADKPYVSVNCLTATETILEKELFGCARGGLERFDRDKGGFQSAQGGTILLEEVGNIPLRFQRKLQQVLKSKAVKPNGVRVISTTTNDLREKIRNGEFIEDLYCRLKGMEISPPPLRERPEDIPLLVEHFRKKYNEKFCKAIEGIAGNALVELMDYGWPGNVRQLEYVIEHAFLHCDDNIISRRHLPAGIQKHRRHGSSDARLEGFEYDNGFHETVKALNKAFWNKSKAAQAMGISRQTLYRKMHEYGLL